MTERPTSSSDRGLAGRLALSRLATRVSMVVERGWPLLLPLVIVASLFLSVSWLGLFPLLPDTARIGLVAAFGIAALAALYPLRFFRMPSAAEIDRRIEAANDLLHSPVLVQTDRPSGKESIFSQALWREHQKRMADRLRGLGADLPRTHVPERDPWGLRAVAALLFVTAFAFSFGPSGGRIEDALQCPRCARRRAAAHRCLGDAAGLYRQATGLPHRADQCQSGGLHVHRSAGQRRVAARHRRFGRGNAELRRRRRQRPRHRPDRTAGRCRQARGEPGNASRCASSPAS